MCKESEVFEQLCNDYVMKSGGPLSKDETTIARHFWQARGTYEAERTKKLVEALDKIAGREIRDDLNYYNACAMIESAREALREYKGEK